MPFALPPQPFDQLRRFDVVWSTPSKDAAGSMPLGNGEVVLNTWVEDKSGDILILFGRTDTLSEISRILKIGRIRVRTGVTGLSQRLNLAAGRIEFSNASDQLRLFVDSSQHVIHLAGKLGAKRSVTVTVENWRDRDRKLPDSENVSAWSALNAPFPRVESADKFLGSPTDRIVWAHRNETSVVPELWKEQSLTGLAGATDPLIHRTFGASVTSRGLSRSSESSLGGEVKSLDLVVTTHCAQTDTLSDWTRQLDGIKSPTAAAEKRTEKWWNDYWQRSWVFVGGDPVVARGYVLQRYVQACESRGTYPVKFNGGYFTVEPTAMGIQSNPDFRKWGDAHWYQNVRHMYHPMLASGDTDMMEAFFRLYESNRTLGESRAKKYYGADGVYFPETMSSYGTYAGGDYGWDRKGLTPGDIQCPWWQWAWNQGPELVNLMLDRYDYTQDAKFLQKRALPMAESVLRYFDTRFKKDASGKIVLDPTQVIETFWHGVINDTPSTAGLKEITFRLTELPADLLSAKQRAFFQKMRDACPDLAVSNGLILPAQKWNPEASNCENPEQYATWPFQIATQWNVKLASAARAAYAKRVNHLDNGWGYDGNVAALLGLTDEAKRILIAKCNNSHPAYRWPATWGPNFDWIPDQNHGGNLLNTTQLMLIQADPLEQGGAIRLLPAWPKQWDVDFKLHAPGNTVVRCVYRRGKVETLEVTPESRRKDVTLPK